MVSTRLARAYELLMKEYKVNEDYRRNVQVADGKSYWEYEDDYDTEIEEYDKQSEEIDRQEDEIRKKIEECKESLRQQGIISHDKQLIAVIDSVLSDVSIDITPRNLDVILSVLPEESKVSKVYAQKPIVIGMGDVLDLEGVGEIYKSCGINLESIDKSLLLDRDFALGYITGNSYGEGNLNRSYIDSKMTNKDIINYVNALAGRGLDR